MRVPILAMILGVLLSVSAIASDQAQGLLTLPCSTCPPTKEDIKHARQAFSQGVKLEKSRKLDQAFQEFDTAARLSPKNIDYVTALAMVRQQLVYEHLQKGNAALLNSKEILAQAEFRNALSLDPENEFAKQRLQDSLGQWPPPAHDPPRVISDSGELRVIPADALHDFHFRGDSRTLLTQVAQAYGVSVEFDDSVVSRRVHFNLDPVDFYTAMSQACAVTGTFWTPLSEKQALVLKETQENHRQFDRMALRTFYVPGTTPPEMNDLMLLLRTIFDVRFFAQQSQNSSFAVRAPVPVLNAITQVIENLGDSRPQVMLDLEVYQIDHQLTRDMGIHIPNQFSLFNIPAAALAALGGQNVQSLVNQLISSGGINQANSQAISALLSQLQSQQNTIFSQPLATFGNGLTFFGVSLGTLSGELSLNESWVRSLQHASLRVAQNNDATFRIGSRYPILNASFAPVFNTPAISQVLQNNSFTAPFPSFTYEDLGLTMKAKPVVHGDLSVGLTLEISLRTLAGQSLNGVPIITNRLYKGSITLVDGAPAVVAGSVTRNEQFSLSGIPGLGKVPGLNKIAATNSVTDQSDELLLVITPHVINSDPGKPTEIWLARQ